MVFPTYLFRLSRAIGLCNLRFVPEKGRFKRDNGALFIYCMVLHFVYVLVIPCIFLMMLHSAYDCQKLDMLAIAYSISSIAKVVSIFLLLSSVWLLRTQWLHMINGFMRIQHQYQRELMHSERVKLWQQLWRMLMKLSRFTLLFHQLFGPPSIFMCDKFDGMRAKFVPVYLVLCLAAILMETLMDCLDSWIYYLINFSNRVLGFMSQETQELRHDLSWLPKRRGCHRNVYQQQLFAAWHKLWNRCLRLDKLTHQMLHILQWQILLNLFVGYLTVITIIFNLVIYSTESDDFHLLRVLAYLLLCTLYYSDVVSHFASFGANRLQWIHLLACIEELWFTLCSMDFDPRTDIYCIAMHRQIEFSIILTNRRLQQRPNRVRRLHIAGLFDLNRRSEFCMCTSIAINVLILCQIAYKYYY
ncbi:hypothetical protein KR044_008019 [Drosophila immigrans]|nr:hypothetical protein KR044_008019 [Drosophila immigrans]